MRKCLHYKFRGIFVIHQPKIVWNIRQNLKLLFSCVHLAVKIHLPIVEMDLGLVMIEESIRWKKQLYFFSWKKHFSWITFPELWSFSLPWMSSLEYSFVRPDIRTSILSRIFSSIVDLLMAKHVLNFRKIRWNSKTASSADLNVPFPLLIRISVPLRSNGV